MEVQKIPPLSDREPFDHAHLTAQLERITLRFPMTDLQYIGESILGRGIPCVRLGHGGKKILYVGTHHGMEWITAHILTRFIEEFAGIYTADRQVFRRSVRQIAESYSVYVIPMLNPDGVEYQIHGIDEENPLYARLLKMNGNSTDFSAWQANARGVDLNHNYDAGFAEYKKLEAENGILEGAPTRFSGEAPGSEPETAALINFIRYHGNLAAVMTLHTQGEEIFWKSGGKEPRGSAALARRISLCCGYRLSEAEGLASFGGLTDWCVQKLDIPSFTIECGKGKNPLPLSDAAGIYVRLRETLFSFPTWL